MAEFLGMPLMVNPNLKGDRFALVCGESMATHDDDGTINIYVRREVGEVKWKELQAEWVWPFPGKPA